MKRAYFVIVVGLAAALAGYVGSYIAGTSTQRHIEKENRPALAWLQAEYHLTDAQFARACQLHDAYQPKCAEMCRKIADCNARVKSLVAATNAITPEIKQALAQSAQLRAQCEQMMLSHFYETAQVMPPEQGKRYLAWVQKETLISSPMTADQPNTHSTNP